MIVCFSRTFKLETKLEKYFEKNWYNNKIREGKYISSAKQSFALPHFDQIPYSESAPDRWNHDISQSKLWS